MGNFIGITLITSTSTFDDFKKIGNGMGVVMFSEYLGAAASFNFWTKLTLKFAYVLFAFICNILGLKWLSYFTGLLFVVIWSPVITMSVMTIVRKN